MNATTDSMFVQKNKLTLEDIEKRSEIRVLFKDSNHWFRFVNKRIMFPWDNDVNYWAEVVEVVEGREGETLEIKVRTYDADMARTSGPPPIFKIDSQELKINKIFVSKK